MVSGFFCHWPLHAGLPAVRLSSQCPSNPASHFWTHTRADEPGRCFAGQMQRDSAAQNPVGVPGIKDPKLL